MDQVAERLAELRERRALTLRELGEMSGVAADTINQIELGHRKARPSTLRKLARALEIDVQEFYAEPALGKGRAPREAGQPEEERRVPETHTDAVHFKGSGTLRASGVVKIDPATLGAIIWRVHQREIGPDEAMEEVAAASGKPVVKPSRAAAHLETKGRAGRAEIRDLLEELYKQEITPDEALELVEASNS